MAKHGSMMTSGVNLALAIIVLLIGLFMTAASLAQTRSGQYDITDSPMIGGQRLMPVITYLLDDSRALALDDVLVKRQSNAFTAPVNTPAVGLNSGALWLSFQINNNRQQAVDIILEHLDANAHHLDLYWRDKGEVSFRHFAYSLYSDRNTRPLMSGKPAFPLQLPANSQTDFMLRIAYEASGFTKADMILWENRQWQLWHFIETALWGIFIGATGLAALLSLYAWRMMRQRALLFYAIYVVLNIVSFLTWPGFMQNILVPSGYIWALQSIPASLAVAMGLIFGREFLSTKRHVPRLDWALRALILIGFLQIPVSLLHIPGIDHGALSMSLVEISFLSYPLLAVAAILCWRRKVPEAGIFCIAWTIYTVSVTTFAFSDLGLMDTTWSNIHLILAGVSIELMLLSYALISRVRQLRNDKEVLEDQYRRSIEDQNKRLEFEVAARTADLEAARIRAEEEARTDGLTQLQNRRSFTENGNQVFALSRRQNRPLSVITLDIDYFKRLNDQYGHQAGDAALVIIAENIRQTLRESDFAGRLGGEEFAILCADTTADNARILAERLRQAIEDCKFVFDHQVLSVTTSLGVAAYDGDASLSALLHRADQALYAAKNAGRNQVAMAETG